jgi:hypothetical protein
MKATNNFKEVADKGFTTDPAEVRLLGKVIKFLSVDKNLLDVKKVTIKKGVEVKGPVAWTPSLCTECSIRCDRDAPEYIEKCRLSQMCYFFHRK